jgi:hypothetical protein
MDTNFLHAWADYLHGFPVAWFESVLNRTELETRSPARLIREISQIIQTRPYKSKWLHPYDILYKFLYILQAQ